MVHVRNDLIVCLLLKLFKLSIVWSEFTTIVHIIPGDEVFLNCSETSSITIRNVSVQNIGKCESNQCYLTGHDLDMIKGCEGSSGCYVNGSLLTSTCLREDRHFNISFICLPEVSYEYVGCYVDDKDRVLGEYHDYREYTWSTLSMSAEICFEKCTENWREDDYFGTQYEYQCFCGNGNKLGSAPYINKKESECDMTCKQNPNEKCGGKWRNSVYRIIIKREFKYEFLNIEQEHTINDCKTSQLKEDSLCITLDTSYKKQDVDYICNDIGNNLHKFCKTEHPNENCVFNLFNILEEADEWQPSKAISIEYVCKENHQASSSTPSSSVNLPTSTLDYTRVSKMSGQTSKDTTDTGTVIGIVVGSVLFLCIVFVGICIRRRSVFCTKSKEKFRNNPETNDYIGNQDIALPQAVSPARHLQYEDLNAQSGNRSTHKYSSTNIHLQNIDDKFDYAKNIVTKSSKTSNDKTSTPTYVVLQDDSYKCNSEANSDEYAVVDPTAELSFKQTPKATTQGPENYMILDPNQTGFNRSKFPNADQAYELAKPIHDTKDQKNDLYVLSPEGTYDHSGITRHHKDQDTIYNHAVDNVYDSANRGLNIARTEDTYDHFFGQETEDEYNISMH
ncbi:uncharacterized protein LOC127708513 [Mytilus californianus]|uniref:uncharacterized protein LOC127708513 n=1 Tax=Mytilus californianus TaxID=6549 RepID=UPI002245B418|nr:uncharacterized protein LOC127708513 [Mytilus californianus]